MAQLKSFFVALGILTLASSASARALDVSLDDRVDPVPVGEEIVYEIDLDVTAAAPAPGVVVTLTLPAGTTFLSARRQPGYAVIPADVDGNQVHFDLGDEEPCNKKDLPACRSIWALVRIDGSVDPGTVLQARVDATSTDPQGFPADAHTTYTSAGTLALRKARVNFAAIPGRDRIQFEGDIGRIGWPSPNDPLPPTLDFSGGIRVKLGAAGEPPVVDVTVPGDAFKCSGIASRRCRLIDPRIWRPLGLDRLNIFLPHDFVQRNNAGILVQSTNLALPPDIGPEMELTVEAGGETYTDSALLVLKGRRLTYTHTQSKP